MSSHSPEEMPRCVGRYGTCEAIEGATMRPKKGVRGWILNNRDDGEMIYFGKPEKVMLDADGLCRLCRKANK